MSPRLTPSADVRARWLLLIVLCLACATTFANDSLNGTWVINVAESDDLQDIMEIVRREQKEVVDQVEEERQKRNEKPTVFGRKRDWDERRARAATSPIPKVMRRMVSAETIKIYYSRKLAISYDGELKRLLQPNPDGRVYSASGSGLTEDAIGQTLSYIEDGVLYIETRMGAGKLIERLDPVSEPGRLVVNWKMKAPAVDRVIEMTGVYDG